MVRKSIAMRGLLLVGAVALPGGAVAASSGDTGPAETTDTSEAPDDTVGDGTEAAADSAVPAGDLDMDFQIDMMLGLVPEDEMEAYYADQGEEQQRQIQACMREAGFEYNIDTQAMSYSDPRGDMSPVEWAQQYGFSVWTQMDPDSNPSQSMEMTEWANEDIVSALSESESNAWFEANNRCNNDTYAEDDIYRNPMVQQAIEDFFQTVANDPRVRDAEQVWRDCMAEAGQPFESQDVMNEQVFAVWNGDEELAALEMQFYESEAWKEDSPDHAQWQALVDEEIAIAVADAGCSPALQATREEVQKDLRPDLVAVWQTIDWELPPVTYPGEGEEWIYTDGSLAPEAQTSIPGDSGPTDSGADSGPAPLDLSGGGGDTTEP